MATRRGNRQPSKLIVILGPTAVGNTSLAIKLAKKFDGEIISADSRQVYKGMNLGTGKVTPAEMNHIPHHLLDVISPKTHFDVVKYQKKAYRAIHQVIQNKHLPFLVGGSPFYLYSIIQGWKFPKVGSLPTLRKNLEQESLETLLSTLAKLDPLYFKKVEKGNRRRIIRAIEIATQLGKVPPRENHPLFSSLVIGLKIPSSQLKILVRQRLKRRLHQGIIQEVYQLHEQGLSWKKLEEFGLEYKWISYYLENKISIEEMKTKLQTAIERFAKRQMTWFKKDPDIHWVQNEEEALFLIKKFLSTSES